MQVKGQSTLLWMIGLVFSAGAIASQPASVPGEFIVKLRQGLNFKVTGELKAALGASEIQSVHSETGVFLVKRQMLETKDYAMTALGSQENVLLVEPNYIYSIVGGAESLPNDPKLDQLWGLINRGQEIKKDKNSRAVRGTAGVDVGAEEAWKIETGSEEVVVAVIDTGVDYTIEDLAPNAWVNEAEQNGEAGVDDDGNGYVDDIYGYDFANSDADPMDDHSHGSHVAGTIAANGNDGVGIVGVAWKARIMAVKFLSRSGGGTLEGAIKAIDYATQMGAQIMNNSWGGTGYSKALEEAVDRAEAAGVLFVAAAGNSGTDNDNRPHYPSSFPQATVLSVAAIQSDGAMASFSCFGQQSVDIAAPGVNILSTTPSGYRYFSGTSMATPHVVGAAALLLAAEGELTGLELKERLMATAQPMASQSGRTVSEAMVNVHNALLNRVPPPNPEDPKNWQSRYAVNHATPSPYPDKHTQTWTIVVPDATELSVHFSKFATEAKYDEVSFKDKDGTLIGKLSGSLGEVYSPVIKGDTVVVEFTADDSLNGAGIEMDFVAHR